MNILTDILGLFKRKKLVTEAKDYDVLVLGVTDQPDIEGIAGPIPPKDAKLIRVKDFVAMTSDDFANIPVDASEAGSYAGESIDTETGIVTQNFRRLKSLSLDLTIEENGDYIEFDLDIDKTSTLLKQNFASSLSKFSTTDFSVGVQTPLGGADIITPFNGYENYLHGTVNASNVIETRKAVGAAIPCPIDIVNGDSINIQIVAQSNIATVELNWKLYKLDPDDLGNGGAAGTTLTMITSGSNLALQGDLTSGGVTTYGREIIYDFTFGGSASIAKGDLLYLGWSYNTITIDPADWVQISAQIRK
jgi:hypothetical protein